MTWSPRYEGESLALTTVMSRHVLSCVANRVGSPGHLLLSATCPCRGALEKRDVERLMLCGGYGRGETPEVQQGEDEEREGFEGP